ncbi:hypothetical protein TVAG_107940 [Trichomonas vaginalis G3]|uniref:Uncharacterized protein n=1 Tax=Trichomonas vaginalis (strain ATCC PRA-98 / G3) TaxID=412133 RepID=A2F7W4_TRIV3|nr:hypothetical protein TVAGG3_1022910 [Trichomonas vaginalis G3]EAX99006.1 hypothetical protein TVAG_107940 [Trichomonas vaginalis G3]KAI5492271.1 hypothetical protein TVAGG3_1022910 [Trichomonas vaginalis G3]|eukprot:XP_001311936.1 hypothetical protein [Trichomonas vaginalis G3]
MHNVNNNISVTGFVSDADCDDEVKVKGIIEGYPNSQTLQSISIPDLDDYQFNFNITIPDNLSHGYHRLNFECCDKTGKCVSEYKSFYYGFHSPRLSIIKIPSFPVYIGKDKFIRFVLSVYDMDGFSIIRIYHRIHKTIGNLVNITLTNESSMEFEYKIPITSEINVGKHNISFFALDQFDFASSYPIIEVEFGQFKSEPPLIYSIPRRRKR